MSKCKITSHSHTKITFIGFTNGYKVFIPYMGQTRCKLYALLYRSGQNWTAGSVVETTQRCLESASYFGYRIIVVSSRLNEAINGFVRMLSTKSLEISWNLLRVPRHSNIRLERDGGRSCLVNHFPMTWTYRRSRELTLLKSIDISIYCI